MTQKLHQRRWVQVLLAVALVLTVVAVPVLGDAAVSVLPLSTTSGEYVVANDPGFEIREADPDADRLNGSVMFNASDPAQIRFVTNDGNVTFRANGGGRATVDTFASRVTLSDVNVSTTALTIDPAGENRTTIKGAATSVSVRERNINDKQTDLSITTQNGPTNVTVPLTNGTGIFAVDGNDNLLDRDVATNGTATLTIPPGTHDVQFRRAGTVTVFNETSPDNPIDNKNLSLTVTVFSNDQVVSQETVTNGRFALVGIDAGRGPFLITVTADGFVTRTVVVPDLFVNQSIFVLPTSEQRVETRFELEDNTGQFPSERALIFVDKIIDRSGTSRYRTIRSGPAAPGGGITTILDQGETYRLRVSDGTGNVRILGTYTAKTAQTVTLSIGRIEFQLKNKTSFQVGADRPQPDRVQFRFEAGQTNASKVSVTVHELNNVSNTLQSTTQFDVANLTLTETLSAAQQNKTFVANYSVTVDGQTVDGVLRFGGGEGSQSPGVPLDSAWKERISIGGLLIIGSLFSAGNIRVGAIVVPGLGGLLWLVGWLPPVTGAVAVATSFIVGVIYTVSTGGGG